MPLGTSRTFHRSLKRKYDPSWGSSTGGRSSLNVKLWQRSFPLFFGRSFSTPSVMGFMWTMKVASLLSLKALLTMMWPTSTFLQCLKLTFILSCGFPELRRIVMLTTNPPVVTIMILLAKAFMTIHLLRVEFWTLLSIAPSNNKLGKWLGSFRATSHLWKKCAKRFLTEISRCPSDKVLLMLEMNHH